MRVKAHKITVRRILAKCSLAVAITLIVFVLCSVSARGQSAGRFSGRVIDRQSQLPLENVSVVSAGGVIGTTSDSLGRFRVTGLQPATYNLSFSSVGYKKQFVYNVVITNGNEYFLTVELDRDPSSIQEVVVTASRKSAKVATLETPLSVQKLTIEEIKSSPGGNFDISKAIQVLPGVGGGQQGGSFRNDIIIRGGAPNENVFYLDGIEIPVINHFQTQGSSGGPQGILNVSFIQDVTLSTSAFDARYDNAISSVFQFKQKNGNSNKLQGNLRLSATELAATIDGPLSRNKNTTFLFSARRSYLQLIFSLIDLPIRPNFWDFQTKITRQIDKRTTLSFVGLGAIDHFRFAPVKDATPEKLYLINANPLINQWNYTGGLALRRSISNGFVNIALSRNSFDNHIRQYEDNNLELPSQLTLSYASRETENKLRLDVNKALRGWKFSYGGIAQFSQYQNTTYNVIRKGLQDSANNNIQQPVVSNFSSPLNNFWKFGFFVQGGRRIFRDRLGVNMGVRSDINTFTTDGDNPLRTISPRASFTYALTDRWNMNATVGRYFKIPTYTVLGFADNSNALVNRSARYLRSDHYVAGFEYLPANSLRFTIEGFLKQYDKVPVSVRNGIALANLGTDFNVLGNEAIVTTGKGRAYGIEIFAQKKLSKRFFGVLSYTIYRSQYSGTDKLLKPGSWDNRHLLSVAGGYKFRRNWELGIKFRYQGGAPYTPYEETLSRLNYLSAGRGVEDFSRLNTLRLRSFHSSDVRIDKKWNFRNTTIDFYIDVTNWYLAKSQGSPSYTFKRNADNTAFLSTDGADVRQDGSNAIPLLLNNDDASATPTVGFIFEF